MYRGWDPELRRAAAVKILRRTPATPPQIDRLTTHESVMLAEARKIASLEITGVATVYDWGREVFQDRGVRNDVEFMAYQLIEGMRLDQWRRATKPDWRQLARMLLNIAEIFAQIHQRGIYHRDVKPSNLLVDASGRPFVIDFGIALHAREPAQASRRAICGTVPYMSPEQAGGETDKIDGRSDLFSLGSTFYELLTSALPFSPQVGASSSPHHVLAAIRDLPPQPPRQLAPDIPTELAAICLRMLNKRRSERYQTASDLAAALRRFLGESEGPSGVPLLVIQTHDAHWAECELEFLRNAFDSASVAAIAEPLQIVEVAADAYVSSSLVRRLTAATVAKLRCAKRQGEAVHLVARTSVQCAFAIGVQMDHQHNCTLYHTQNGRLHRIWEMDRATKNARSPSESPPSCDPFFTETHIEPRSVRVDVAESGPDRASPNRECVAIQVGANEIIREVRQWRDRFARDAVIRCLTKRRSELSPLDCSDWIEAASEIAKAVKSSPADDVYLFIDAPAALALMAGDALGHWARKRIHLMQFCRDVASPVPYVCVLTLPDAELNAAVAAGTLQEDD
ncbi:MAG: serine/threonine protein kinase [Planctomycetales bacterium]|nr:serine/threonine protein kinase [Planctomycetales bacterium]